ncbi:MAG: hypothetical protein V2I67_18955, partial [Thermoanaerobaculales bacterium]|nr:hypothetical protein [Thermoanaerobaculales bacterium]
FGLAPATLVPHELGGRGIFRYGTVVDLHTGDVIELDREPVVIPRCGFRWLKDGRPSAGF